MMVLITRCSWEETLLGVASATSLLDSPTTSGPLSDRGVVFCIFMGSDPTRSTFVFGNYLYVNGQSKLVRSMLFLGQAMRHHARSCNVMQCHARSWKSCKVMQIHANSCKVELHTRLVHFSLLRWRFACIQVFSGGWTEVVVYHRWSTEFGLVYLCCLFRKRSLFARHFKNPISSCISLAQLLTPKGHGLRIQIEAIFF